MPITFPDKITGAQLKHIAWLCGQPRHGTKAVIADRITGGLQDFEPLAPGTRVLSLDLGIRNLAYSLLEIPKPRPRSKGQNPSPVTPILRAWERLALIPKAPGTTTTKKKTKKSTAEKTVEDGNVIDVDETAAPTSKPKKRSKPTTSTTTTDTPPDPSTDQAPLLVEDFSPTRLSRLAVDLILTRLLPLRPDIVTLEQQRFRSKGAVGVLEWTLRVNSLESMLYAIFTTLSALDHWPGGRVKSVVARNVLNFLAAARDGGMTEGDTSAKYNYANYKNIKMGIVGDLLMKKGSEGVIVNGPDDVVREYLEQFGRKGKPGRKPGAEAMKKLDDLADSLLQGIAFIRWQENKGRLMEEGVEALLPNDV